uniref:Histone deacetylase 11 n=1 Tax=Sciurus vulgaris TaxID=55149 RepID=A0A8D2D4A0_SCIVU
MPHSTQLYQHVPETHWPIVYSPRYNITFMGLEKLHPFDAGKWGKVVNYLKEAIRRKVELDWGTEDDEYLSKVERNVEKALQEHSPDVVIYNAGTDVLEGDRLGGLAISPGGIVKRDELVFRVVRGQQIPILMVTSGGYQKRTARIIADSILNLHSLDLIGPESPNVSSQNSDTPLLSSSVP